MTDDGRDWPDNAFRFGALGWIAAHIGIHPVAGFAPDILHGHDWQAGLAMAYLAYGGDRRPATVFTVHNLAYQGQFPADLLDRLRLPAQAWGIDGVEHYGAIGFLKAGLQFADRITTVSPTYAREIQTAAGGCGLEGLLRARAGVLSGICNGIDVDVWNPETDNRIASRFSRSSLPARSLNKAELQRRFALGQDPERLLFGVVSRLAWHKGIDILADAIPALIGRGGQLVVLGTGEPELEHRLRSLADAHRGRIGCLIGYDEDLAHLIQAGSDARAGAVAFRALRADPALRHALRSGADRGQSGRTGRHHRRFRGRRGRWQCRDRHAFSAGDAERARSHAPSRRRPVERPPGLAIPAGERHAGRRILGRARTRLFRPLFHAIGVQKVGRYRTSSPVRQAHFLQAS